jgi:glycosyltransferase involved in cell wall biosynthesis
VTAVHFVVPEGIDDPARPSGGNAYDRQVSRGLAALGWTVHELPTPGEWPFAGAQARRALQALIASIPNGSVVLVDGLIASGVPDVLVPEARRLRLVVLMHMPLGLGRPRPDGAAGSERAVLHSAEAVITTSDWTRRQLIAGYRLPPQRVRVAEPGVACAALAAGTVSGGRFLCVGAVTPIKGHDVLLDALGAIRDLSWRCTCVGSLEQDPGFVEQLARQAHDSGITDRVAFRGPRVGSDLDLADADSDVLLLASRFETYGMVVTEALSRGLPVIAAAVGGIPEALGHAPGGTRPGILVPPGNSAALANALRRWLDDPDFRVHLRAAARTRRLGLKGWGATANIISEVLAEAGQVAA